MRFTNYFHFSHRERTGTFVLFILCTAIFAAPSVLRTLRPESRTDFSAFQAIIREYRQHLAASQDTAVQLFDFDPNLATREDFIRLGLPEKVAGNICRYREKGGVFRKPEDFQKIWGLEPKLYEQLLPYLRISEKNGRREFDSDKPFSFQHFDKKREMKPMDLNAATEESLDALPMIGEKRAAQILHFREKLGGFLSVDQLAEMYQMPDSVFQAIRPYLFIGKPAGHFNLNTATVEVLDAHPYISRKQAELIVAYREQHGPYASKEAVLNIKAFNDPAWWEKVSPYLSVE